jgi:ankyrin repeat protein
LRGADDALPVQDSSGNNDITNNVDKTQPLDKKPNQQNLSQPHMSPKFEAALVKQDAEKVKELLAAGGAIARSIGVNNNTALIITMIATDLSLDIVKLLLNAGVELDGRESKDGLQALHICAAQAMAAGNMVRSRTTSSYFGFMTYSQ